MTINKKRESFISKSFYDSTNTTIAHKGLTIFDGGQHEQMKALCDAEDWIF